MSRAALDEVIACEEALIAALDKDDIAGLERAIHGMRGLLATIAANGTKDADDAYRERLKHAMSLAEQAGGRINYLIDDTRRRIERLSAIGGQSTGGAYGRGGRFA